MRSSFYWPWHCAAALLAACCIGASANSSNTATWTRPLPAVNWQPADLYVANSLHIEAGVATMMFGEIGRSWRLRVNDQGHLLSREYTSFVGERSVSNANPLVFATASGDLGQSPSFIKCLINAFEPGLELAWRHQLAASSCRDILMQKDGGLASVTDTAVISLDRQGQIRWQRNWSEIEHNLHPNHVQRLVETATGRLLALSKVVWVLDGSTGQPLAVHDLPGNANERVLAVRERADQTIEWLALSYQNGQERATVLRWSAQGDFIDSSPLGTFFRLHSAMAHPAGFIVLADVAPDVGEIHFFDGTQLRWRAPLAGSAQYHEGGVERQGTLLLPRPEQLLRFDSNGQELQPFAIENAAPVYAEDGSLWVLESRTLRYFTSPRHSFTLWHYPPGAATASFRLPLQLPIRPMHVVDLRIDPVGDLQLAGALLADSALGTTHRLQIHHVHSTGTFGVTRDLEWPDSQIDALLRMNSGWMVRSKARFVPHPPFSEYSWLRRLDEEGQLLWEKRLSAYPFYDLQQACDDKDQCGVVFEGAQRVFQRFDSNGAVQLELTGDAAKMRLYAEAGRLYGIRHNGPDISLLDVSATPPLELATVQSHNHVRYLPQRARLLVISAAGLSSHAGNQVVWTRPDIPELAQLSIRQDRLHVGLKTAEGPLRVLQLDPDTGSTLSSIDLPAEFIRFGGSPVITGHGTVVIDAAADGEQWLLADTATDTRLLALVPAAPVRQFKHVSRIRDIRAVPGAVFAISVVNSGDVDAQERLAVSRFTLDLFSDGFEQP